MREIAAILTILIGLAGMAHAQASETSNQAIVLLIDTSGSMRDENRLAYAKEAAKAVARQLKDADLFGVIGFNINPYIVVFLDKMANNRKVVDAQIDRLKPAGQTDFLPALTQANNALEYWSASKKHVILLSDGITRGSRNDLINQVYLMKLKLNITVSAIAISKEADVRLMKSIAQYGGGFFQLVCDASTMPQVMAEQLFSNTGTPQPNSEAQTCP